MTMNVAQTIKKHTYTIAWFLLAGLVLLSCQKKVAKVDKVANQLPRVVTTIAPYEFLLQELAGDLIEIINTSAHSADPHNVNLTPQQSYRLKTAKLFFSLNPTEERLILQSLGEGVKIVEMWHGFPLLTSAHKDEDAPADDHLQDTTSWDEHFWLDPMALHVQIAIMAQELRVLLPEYAQHIQQEEAKLFRRSLEVAEYMQKTLPQLQQGKILSFHSALAYFARFFSATEMYIEYRGIELGSKETLELFKQVRELTFPLLIYSPQFQQEKAIALAKQLQLGAIPFDPLLPDVFANLRNLTARLAKSVPTSPAAP